MQGVVVACGGEKRFGNLVTQVQPTPYTAPDLAV